MSYNIQCDVCATTAQVNENGQLPEGWGVLEADYYPELKSAEQSEYAEAPAPELKVVKGNVISAHVCDRCAVAFHGEAIHELRSKMIMVLKSLAVTVRGADSDLDLGPIE